MSTRLILALALFAGPAVAADLPPPPPASAIKQVHVDYGRALHVQATAEIAARDAQIAAAHDVRAEVLDWARGQALTQSVQFTLSAAGDLTLSWQDRSDNEAGFRIYRSADGGATFAPIAEVPADLTTWTDRGLLVGATYAYFITAYAAEVESAPSNTAAAPAK